MKYIGNHYEDYVIKNKKFENKKVMTILKKLPNDIKELKNMIFYGASGIGKYSHMITCIKKYSPSNLKYEKKINVVFNKEPYYFKISDIHYEIDISLLGCNSKQLWYELFTHIVDIIYSKPVKNGIIVCKYFNEIQPELLENFYSYMQKCTNQLIDLKFILLCEHISFLPENILNCCEIVPFSKPKNMEKPLYSFQHYDLISNKIYKEMTDPENLRFLPFRESIYDIFSYNLSINICIWKILELLVKNQKVRTTRDISNILIKMFGFLKLYQNNYRPISHVEYFFYTIVNTIR